MFYIGRKSIFSCYPSLSLWLRKAESVFKDVESYDNFFIKLRCHGAELLPLATVTILKRFTIPLRQSPPQPEERENEEEVWFFPVLRFVATELEGQ